MQGEPDSVRRLVESLTGEALKQFLNNLRHHVEVQRRVARGQLRQDQVNVAYVKYALREGAGYRDEVGMLTARYYRDLIDLGTRYSERFYKQVLEASPSASVGGDADGAPERESLELHGPRGHEVVRRIALENTDSDEAEVTFELGECRGPDGVPFTAPLAVQPARLTIPSGGRAEITLRLALLPSLFVPGNVYAMNVDVHGQQELALDLVIWAEEDARPAATPSASEAPRAKSSGPLYELHCPECGRTFSRTRKNSRLNAHKAPDGKPCPGRSGKLVGAGEGESGSSVKA
jgi:hypothetical protein